MVELKKVSCNPSKACSSKKVDGVTLPGSDNVELVRGARMRRDARRLEINQTANAPHRFSRTRRDAFSAGPIMALMFPNASRSFDATRRAVRFWGYRQRDGMVVLRDGGCVETCAPRDGSGRGRNAWRV